jgi:hypothetical protein
LKSHHKSVSELLILVLEKITLFEASLGRWGSETGRKERKKYI